jgi:hypothetical protein
MKALSLWQPWASLMAVGAKKIETRSWPTSYRGLIAIHAAKKWDADLAEQTLEGRFFRALFHNEGGFTSLDQVPRGCFIAVGRLTHCISTSDHPKLIPAKDTNEYHFGNYAPGRFMWVFDEIWKLSSPVYSRGYQQLWTPDEGAKDVITALLPEEAAEVEEANA